MVIPGNLRVQPPTDTTITVAATSTIPLALACARIGIPRIHPRGGPARNAQDPHIYNVHSAANDWQAKFDGIVQFTTNSNTTNFSTQDNAHSYIGYNNNTYFNGSIAEILLFDRKLTAAERNQVNSALAIKYGVTLGDNGVPFTYVDSGGATIWNNATYHNDVAGIGRDDSSALYQKQSRSVHDDTVLSIAIGTHADSNQAAAGTFATTGQFLIWGNDGGTPLLTEAFSSSTPADMRMNRVWQVANTNSVGGVEVCVLSNRGTEYRSHLVVNAGDNTFASGNIETALTPKVINSENYMCANGVTLSDGDYLTFAGIVTAPGGVGTNLQYWVRADGQIADNGTQVTSWIDETGLQGDFDFSTGTPKLEENIINFNPAVDFMPNAYLRYTSKRFILNATEGEIFYVLQNTDTPTVHSGYPGQFGGYSCPTDTTITVAAASTIPLAPALATIGTRRIHPRAVRRAMLRIPTSTTYTAPPMTGRPNLTASSNSRPTRTRPTSLRRMVLTATSATTTTPTSMAPSLKFCSSTAS